MLNSGLNYLTGAFYIRVIVFTWGEENSPLSLNSLSWPQGSVWNWEMSNSSVFFIKVSFRFLSYITNRGNNRNYITHVGFLISFKNLLFRLDGGEPSDLFSGKWMSPIQSLAFSQRFLVTPSICHLPLVLFTTYWHLHLSLLDKEVDQKRKMRSVHFLLACIRCQLRMIFIRVDILTMWVMGLCVSILHSYSLYPKQPPILLMLLSSEQDKICADPLFLNEDIYSFSLLCDWINVALLTNQRIPGISQKEEPCNSHLISQLSNQL